MAGQWQGRGSGRGRAGAGQGQGRAALHYTGVSRPCLALWLLFSPCVAVLPRIVWPLPPALFEGERSSAPETFDDRVGAR